MAFKDIHKEEMGIELYMIGLINTPVACHGCCEERVEPLMTDSVDVNTDSVAPHHHPHQLVPALAAGQVHCSQSCSVLQVGVSAGVGEQELEQVSVASRHCSVEET